MLFRFLPPPDGPVYLKRQTDSTLALSPLYGRLVGIYRYSGVWLSSCVYYLLQSTLTCSPGSPPASFFYDAWKEATYSCCYNREYCSWCRSMRLHKTAPGLFA